MGNLIYKHAALICDDAYVMPTVVTVKSLIENIHLLPDERLIVHICTFSLNSENKAILRKLNSDNASVEILEVDQNAFQKKIELVGQKSHVTHTSLIKFELPNLFLNIDNMLYLDSDIVIKRDINELFNINLSDYYMAASAEFWKYLNGVWNGYKVSEIDFYFNSGVMMMNLKKMREDNLTQSLWDAKLTGLNDPSRKTMDQDSLNDVCAKKTLPLSIKWNFNTAFSNDVDLKLINQVFNERYNSFEELFEDVRVIHYVGKEEKPWKYENAIFRELWDSYYLKAGFNINELTREKVTHGLGWYVSVLRGVIKQYGVVGAIRYCWFKIKNRGR